MRGNNSKIVIFFLKDLFIRSKITIFAAEIYKNRSLNYESDKSKEDPESVERRRMDTQASGRESRPIRSSHKTREGDNQWHWQRRRVR